MSRAISLYFSLLAGNLEWRPVREGLGPQPAINQLISHAFCISDWLGFIAVCRAFLSVTHNPIYGRDGLTRDLGDSGRGHLSGGISWFTFLR